jgi:XTP/dITP diphosphohydrolase
MSVRVRALVATRSGDKLREIRRVLGAGACLDLLSLDDLGIPESQDEGGIEIHETFELNALAKARHFARVAHMLTLSDDSGLCVEALDGGPGVRSKRYSGPSELSGAALDAANNAKLLDALSGLPDAGRAARYVCAAAVVRPTGEEAVFVGECRGTIVRRPRAGGGFGYDPLFEVEGLGRTFGELSADEKARCSHRARAFRALQHALCGSGIDA